MSVGHVARGFEVAGISTVIVASSIFEKSLKAMVPPRVLLTPHPMGRPVGPPFEKSKQKNVLRKAFQLLETAKEGNTFEYYEESYM